jgi:hypothetical protein
MADDLPQYLITTYGIVTYTYLPVHVLAPCTGIPRGAVKLRPSVGSLSLADHTQIKKRGARLHSTRIVAQGVPRTKLPFYIG